MDVDALRKAGEICRRIKKELPSRVRPGVPLLEVAEWVEAEIRRLGAEPAFPVNISIDAVAAHFSPSRDCRAVFEEGQLVKVDFGAHIGGWPTDNSITIDLGEHGELVAAAEDALRAASEVLLARGPEATLSELGRAIEEAIRSRGFSPITNLTGHSMEQWVLHSGTSIHNYDTGLDRPIGRGLFAVEPFATPGRGRVKNGQPSEIFRFLRAKPQRLPALRALMVEVSRFRLPFSSRWVSSPQYLGLLVKSGALHSYPELVEVSGMPVSQAEHSFVVGDKTEVLT